MAPCHDPDEYRKAGSFVMPEDARWESIWSRHAQADDIKMRLDDVLKALEDAYPDKLQGAAAARFTPASNMSRENVTAADQSVLAATSSRPTMAATT